MTAGANAVESAGDILGELDALVCVSDPVAFGVMMALQRRGLRVPEDVAVTGFGAFEIAHVSNPTITTVSVHADRIGEITGAIIVDILGRDGEDLEPLLKRLTPDLQIGESG